MGQLIVGIREAEERLAAIGRALQSAYEEQIREATLARDTAAQGVARAQAMETAARSLGQSDIAVKIAEVIASLRSSETAAVQRLSELATIEKTVQLRLSEPERTPGPAVLPALTSIPPGMASMPPGGGTVSPSSPLPGTLTPSALSTTPAPEGASSGRDELLGRQEQLIARIDELDRVARRWPIEIAKCGIQEHVALARLISRRFDGLGRQGESRIPTALQRLQTLAAAIGAEGILGFDGENADWARIASEARNQRLVLVEARRRGAAA